jgi:hypothetical protein
MCFQLLGVPVPPAHRRVRQVGNEKWPLLRATLWLARRLALRYVRCDRRVSSGVKTDATSGEQVFERELFLGSKDADCSMSQEEIIVALLSGWECAVEGDGVCLLHFLSPLPGVALPSKECKASA